MVKMVIDLYMLLLQYQSHVLLVNVEFILSMSCPVGRVKRCMIIHKSVYSEDEILICKVTKALKYV